MRTSTTHAIPTQAMQDLIDEVAAVGHEVEVDGVRREHHPQYAGLSYMSGQLQSAPGKHDMVMDGYPLVAREGYQLMALTAAQAYMITAFELAGCDPHLVQLAQGDLFSYLRDQLAGVALVPAGTGGLTRAEVKVAAFTLCVFGTRIPVNAVDIDAVRRVAAVVGVSQLLPQVARAARNGFHDRVLQESGRATWSLLLDARARVGELGRAVGLNPDTVFLEVHPDVADLVRARVTGMAVGSIHLGVEGPGASAAQMYF